MSDRAHTRGRETGLPFEMDQRAQAAVLSDLPESVAQEAGEFYENHGGAKRGTLLKRECMAHAWAQVLRPYLIGLRDWYAPSARPSPWLHLESAPEDQWVLLATTGGWVGEALMLRSEETGKQLWQWSSGKRINEKLAPLKWMPLPEHPESSGRNRADATPTPDRGVTDPVTLSTDGGAGR